MGGSEKQGEERKGNSPPAQFPMGRPKSPPLLPDHWASASQEKKIWVGVRDVSLGSGMGEKGRAKARVPSTAPHLRGSPGKYRPLLKVPRRGSFGQRDPKQRALVCGLAAQGRNQVIGASKWWELQDCESLAESWSTWILGCSSKKEGTAALPGVVPDIPEPTLPDSGLGAPQKKGHHHFRQCNSCKIKDGEKR